MSLRFVRTWMLAALVAAGAGAARAGTLLTWTGAGDDDNLSTAENWSPAQTPVTGDSLLFCGATRTTPYNDLDPASVTIYRLLFTNNCSVGYAQPFTLSGNKMKLSYGVFAKSSSSALTETIACDIQFTGGAGFGGWSGSKYEGGGNRILKFTGSVSGTGQMWTTSQFGGQLRFEGPVSGFTDFYRPNGGGSQYFLGKNTAFSGAGGYHFGQGNAYFIDADNFGPAPKFFSGQGLYGTAGSFTFTPTNGVTITANPGVASPSQSTEGLYLVVNGSDGTVTFTGNIYEDGTKNDLGTLLVLKGTGRGIIAGKFLKDRMALKKDGAGTWTLDEDIPSCALTGLVSVAAGKLVVNTTVPTLRVSVSKGATLSGCGQLGTAASTVSFANGAVFEALVEEGAVRPMTFPGTVSLAGPVTVNLPSGATLAAGSSTTLATAGAWSGTGSFTLGTGFPENTVLTRTETALTADVPSDILTWSGKTSAEWNKTDQNWDGTKVYDDGAMVVFPDLEDATKRTVSIPSALTPQSVTVSAAAGHPYAFEGAGGLADTAEIAFNGTATNVWSVPLADVGNVNVAAGGLIVSGDLARTSIRAQKGTWLQLAGDLTDGVVETFHGSTFSQTASSVIGGSTALTLKNTTATLSGTNTFTGGLTLGECVSTGSGNPTSKLYVRSPKGLGSGGTVRINYSSYVYISADIAETNRTLHLYGYNNYCYIKPDSGKKFEWAGDIYTHDYPQTSVFESDYATFILGKKDLSSVFSVANGRSLTHVGTFHLYSRYVCGGEFNFRGTTYLYNTNTWSSFAINTGTGVMMATNALCRTGGVRLLQSYAKISFAAALDLNGYDQTVAYLSASYDSSVANYGYVRSAKPAVLTVSNVTATAFNDAKTFYVQGAVTLRKCGSAKWTLGCQNTSSGDVVVEQGTLAIAAKGSLPTKRTSTLRIADGATLMLNEGVAEEVTRAALILSSGEKAVGYGLYGGPDCTDASAKKVTWLSGTGTLRVRHGPGGLAFVLK